MTMRRINNPGAVQQTKNQLVADTLYNAYLKYSDVQANGVAGGAASAATWHTRTLNTEDSDTDNIGSLSSNRITLPPGTYFVNAVCPARKVDAHRAKIYNVTTAADLLNGTNAYSASTDGVVTNAVVSGKFTLTQTSEIEVRHYCVTAAATDGLGVVASIAGQSECYTTIDIWRFS